MDMPSMSESLDLARSYRVMDECFAVLSESPGMAHHIHTFMKWLELSPGLRKPCTIRLLLFEARGSQIALCSPELGVAALHALGGDAWVAFRRMFMYLVASSKMPYFIFHAAAVANERDHAFVIAGESDAGKTTVLASILKRGFRLLCDDYTPIDLHDAKILSLPVGSTVTEETCQMIPELNTLRREECRFECQGQWQWTINLGDAFPVVPAYQTCLPRHFFFLSRNLHEKSAIRECGEDECLWRIFSSRLTMGNGGGSSDTESKKQREGASLAMARRLLASCHFFDVQNNDFQRTTDLILDAMRK